MKALQENNAYLYEQCRQLTVRNNALLKEGAGKAGNAEVMNEKTAPGIDEATKEERTDKETVRKCVLKEITTKRKHSGLIDSQTLMLEKLYEERELGITATALFKHAGMTAPTGFRNIGLFKRKSYVAFIGARKKGKYILTKRGLEMLQGKDS